MNAALQSCGSRSVCGLQATATRSTSERPSGRVVVYEQGDNAFLCSSFSLAWIADQSMVRMSWDGSHFSG